MCVQGKCHVLFFWFGDCLTLTPLATPFFERAQKRARAPPTPLLSPRSSMELDATDDFLDNVILERLVPYVDFKTLCRLREVAQAAKATLDAFGHTQLTLARQVLSTTGGCGACFLRWGPHFQHLSVRVGVRRPRAVARGAL